MDNEMIERTERRLEEQELVLEKRLRELRERREKVSEQFLEEEE